MFYVLKYVNKKHSHSLKADFSLKHLKKTAPSTLKQQKHAFSIQFSANDKDYVPYHPDHQQQEPLHHYQTIYQLLLLIRPWSNG